MNDKKIYPQKSAMRSKEVGLISAITVLSQFVSGNISTKNVNDEIHKLQLEVSQMRLERAEHYVNKSDFRLLDLKVDKANDQLSTLKTQTASIKTFLKSKMHYSLHNEHPFSLTESLHEYKRFN